MVLVDDWCAMQSTGALRASRLHHFCMMSDLYPYAEICHHASSDVVPMPTYEENRRVVCLTSTRG